MFIVMVIVLKAKLRVKNRRNLQVLIVYLLKERDIT